MSATPLQISNPDILYKMAEKHDVTLRIWPKDWESDRKEIEKRAKEFAPIYKNRPFDNNNGHIGPGCVTLSYYMNKYKPPFVIESGCWRGFSTWAMEQAKPDTKFVCLDPVFASEQFMNKSIYEPTYRTPKAQYFSKDFSTITLEIDEAIKKKALIFFDDHQDKLPRLIQAKNMGFKYILFDDDLPFRYTHTTFQNYFSDPNIADQIFSIIKRYEILPPLYSDPFWRNKDLKFQGLDLPETEELSYLKEVVGGYSWISFIELK